MATFRCYGEHDAVEPHRSLGYSQLQLETDTAQTGLGVDWRQGQHTEIWGSCLVGTCHCKTLGHYRREVQVDEP